MRNFGGLMRAYWFSERWPEAWCLTIVIALLTAASSKAGVWMAESSGDLVNAIATFHDHDNLTPVNSLFSSAGMLLALVLVKDAGIIGVRGFLSSTLHRKWRGWLDLRFNQALLDANHTHLHVQHAAGTAEDAAAPDNIDQRVQEAIKGMTGGAIGLAMGVVGVLTSLFFVGQALIGKSVAIAGLGFLGHYGSAVLALVAVALYVPINTFIALKLGGVMERLNVAMQQAEGTYRGELTTFLRRSLQLAASGGEEVQKDMHRRLYGKIDDNWGRLNKVNACYMSFQLTYDFLSARIVAYLPGLLSYMRGQIGLRNYITGAELVNSLIGQCSWFIHVMPAIATLRANARRVTDLAEAIERVRRPREFYRLTGRSDFRIGRQDARFGLTIRRLELTHQGRNAMPFLTTANLYFHPGEWTFIKGESGTGKTCFLKAVNGLWPHGSGEIMLPEGAISLYATQDVKLQPLSLKQLVCLPDSESRHSDTRVAAALHKAGLGSLIEHLPDEERGGKRWDQVLSGGQKQKLVLARILLHQPGLLFLDEACGALDPESRMAFHQAIKENCPDTIVLSVMHDEEPPISDEGVAFYDSILQFEGGMAIKFGLQPNWAPERVAAPLH